MAALGFVGVAVAMAGCAPPGGGSSAYRYVVPVSAGVTVSYGGVGSHHDYPRSASPAAEVAAWSAANPGACAAAMADPYAPDA